MSDTAEDVAGGEQPLPGVDTSPTARYPIWLERLLTIGCLIGAFLLVPDVLAATHGLNRALQLPLAYCGLPIAALIAARLLQLVVHKSWNRLKA